MENKRGKIPVAEFVPFMNSLNSLLEHSGMTNTEFGRRIGVKPASITCYRQGQQMPDCIRLAKIAEVLHTTTDYLLGRTTLQGFSVDAAVTTQLTGLSNKNESKFKNSKPEYEIFAGRITRALEMRGMSAAQLAGLVRVSPAGATRWTRGEKTPKAVLLVDIAKALDVSTDFLLGLSDYPTASGNTQTVCEITGLPPSTVEALTAFQSRLAKAGLTNPNPLDEFLTSNEFDTIFRGLETLSYPMQATAKGHSINAANLPTPVINAMLDGVCYQMSEALTKYLLNLKAKQTTQQINETDNQT